MYANNMCTYDFPPWLWTTRKIKIFFFFKSFSMLINFIFLLFTFCFFIFYSNIFNFFLDFVFSFFLINNNFFRIFPLLLFVYSYFQYHLHLVDRCKINLSGNVTAMGVSLQSSSCRSRAPITRGTFAIKVCL